MFSEFGGSPGRSACDLRFVGSLSEMLEIGVWV
jgi:hypothetical protein